MINYEIHNNLLNIEDLNLASNLSSLTPQDKGKLDSVQVLQVKEKAYFQRDMISVFRNFLGFCLKDHNVYLILLEAYPQTKNRIRSKKGLLHKHKEEVEKHTVFETETEVSADETLLAGIIRVTGKSIDYIIDHFDDFPFAFGLITPRRSKAFKTNREDFLESIVVNGLKPGKIYWKNWLKIAALLVKPGNKFFSLHDLNDTEHFRIFYHKSDSPWGQRLEGFMLQELSINPTLQTSN